jgi:guanylate kinase
MRFPRPWYNDTTLVKAKIKRKKGLLVVISGPSGVGKSTVVRQLLKNNPKFKLSISATTRKPRPGEKNGRDYHFLSEKVFYERIKAREFLEWANVHNSYYGTPLKYVRDRLVKGDVVILEVDVQGASSIKEAIAKSAIDSSNAVFVFLIPPSVDILAFRLKRRKTEKKDEMNFRLRNAIDELQVMEKYDYIVVNDKVESAADKISAIIKVEKERTFLN